jgi:UPF0271 protein
VAVKKQINTISGKLISAEADTVCCHGDSPNAAEVVKKVKEEFQKLGIPLKSLVS